MERERLKTGKRRRSWRAQEPGGYGRDEQPADGKKAGLVEKRACLFLYLKEEEGISSGILRHQGRGGWEDLC